MSQCVLTNPACIKQSSNSEARFCAVCGQSAAQARGLGGATAQAVGYIPQSSGPGIMTQLKIGLMADLSARRSNRDPSTVQSSLLAAGGVLVGLGICLIFLDVMYGGYDENILGGSIVALGALAGIWFIAFKFAEYLVGAVSVIQLIIPAFMFAVFTSEIEKGKIGLPILLTGILLGLFWALPGFRGRPTLLATAAGWATTGVATLTIESELRYGYQGLEINSLDFIAQQAGVVVMVLGIAQLIIGWNLDRKLWPNLATPFIAIGIYSAIAGATGYLSSGDYGDFASIILLIALSLGLIFIGGVASRRATTWIGTTFLAGGLIGLVISVLGDDFSATDFSLVAILVGAGVGFLGNKFANQLLSKYKISQTKSAANTI